MEIHGKFLYIDAKVKVRIKNTSKYLDLKIAVIMFGKLLINGWIQSSRYEPRAIITNDADINIKKIKV